MSYIVHVLISTRTESFMKCIVAFNSPKQSTDPPNNRTVRNAGIALRTTVLNQSPHDADHAALSVSLTVLEMCTKEVGFPATVSEGTGRARKCRSKPGHSPGEETRRPAGTPAAWPG